MSIFFQIDGADVWNPSNSVARLFIAQALTTGRELGFEPGIGPVVDDECNIDGQLFATFISSVITRHRETNNLPLKLLIEGIIPMGVIMLERAKIFPIESNHTGEDFWRERSVTVSKAMPQ
ncbi:DUF6086 family protein [Streptomyces sp. NPDC046866]|uniref:DUF6086 family protein n=1 Tax=Streptomyces sp. NPDC046866 TaxID=3154921 RepID=UPI0034516C63